MEEREFRYIRLILFFITLHPRRWTWGLILISIVLFNYKHSFYEKSGQHYFWILLMVTRSWNYIHRMVICLSELSCNTAKWHLRKKHKYSASPYTLNTFCIIIWLIFCYILTSRKQHCEIIFVHARILIHCSFTHRRTRKQSNAEQAQIRKYIIRYTIKISIKYQTKLSLSKYGIRYVQIIFT